MRLRNVDEDFATRSIFMTIEIPYEFIEDWGSEQTALASLQFISDLFDSIQQIKQIGPRAFARKLSSFQQNYYNPMHFSGWKP